MKYCKSILAAVVVPLLFVVPVHGQGAGCFPPCVNPHTYCPSYGGIRNIPQCQCVSGYVPFVPAEPAFGPTTLECLEQCGPDQIRPVASRAPCTNCTGPDSKPNRTQTRCLTRTC